MTRTQFSHQDGRTLAIDGAELYVEEIGNPDGPTVLMLHGGFGSCETFNAITPALAGRYRLIGIDSRGQGQSTLGDAPLSYARLQQDVEAITQQLGLSRYSVIGFSDGGILALRLAANPANPIDRIISIGGHWQLATDDPSRATFAKISTAFWKKYFPEEYARYHEVNPAPDFDTLVEHIRALWLDETEDGYPGELVRNIRVPLLVIHGEDDPVVLRNNPLELVERVDGARLLWLPFTGHASHEERPGWITPAIEVFLGMDATSD